MARDSLIPIANGLAMQLKGEGERERETQREREREERRGERGGKEKS